MRLSSTVFCKHIHPKQQRNIRVIDIFHHPAANIFSSILKINGRYTYEWKKDLAVLLIINHIQKIFITRKVIIFIFFNTSSSDISQSIIHSLKDRTMVGYVSNIVPSKSHNIFICSPHLDSHFSLFITIKRILYFRF